MRSLACPTRPFTHGSSATRSAAGAAAGRGRFPFPGVLMVMDRKRVDYDALDALMAGDRQNFAVADYIERAENAPPRCQKLGSCRQAFGRCGPCRARGVNSQSGEAAIPDSDRGFGNPEELAKALEQAAKNRPQDQSKFANRSNNPRPTRSPHTERIRRWTAEMSEDAIADFRSANEAVLFDNSHPYHAVKVAELRGCPRPNTTHPKLAPTESQPVITGSKSDPGDPGRSTRHRSD